jgi:two-component system, chemotaxis family, CheB/CheR fusion protein
MSPAVDKPPSEHAAAASNTVMIIEDDPMVREMLELLFKSEGHRTASFANGRTAIDETVTGGVAPDILVADYNLPGGLTGLQTITALRRAFDRELPAIILTGDISTGTLRTIAEQRCVHLNKPANAEELLRVVENLLGAQRRLRANGREPLLAGHASKRPPIKLNGDPSSPTIFVVDDDAALCSTMLQLLELDGRAVETFPSSEAFLETYRPTQQGCLVVDAHMQGMGGLALLERLKREGSQLPAIMITGYGDVSTAVRAMRAGAVDFIEKPIKADELLASIDGALARTQDSGKRSAWHAAAAKCIADLTPREHEVMDLVLAGHPSKNIAADLGISQRTVENHRASIMKKTGSKSIPALIRTVLAAA